MKKRSKGSPPLPVKKGASAPQALTVGKWKVSYPTLAAGCILLGVLVRLVLLGEIPGGLNQDEAFAGYEAWSLLHYGVDSFGYPFPVYLTAWGSGMNALNSYLMIPFLALFGPQGWVLRLPQALVGCFSLWVFWLLLRRSFDESTALWGVFFLAICPWHIMACRWGLESNLAPGFLLFGLYFFLRGVENSRFYLLSALFYGLSLYCYAAIWPIVPLLLLLQALYLFRTGKLVLDRFVISAVLLLALLATPALLFLLVNKGLLPEIRTPFLSVPKLLYMRDGELSLSPAALWSNWKNTFHILLEQNDGLYWNSTGEYGLYYKGTLIFAALGLLHCGKRALESWRERRFDGAALCLIPFLGALVLGGLISVNVNRINVIHLPIILLIAVGLSDILRLLGQEFRHIGALALAALTLAFCSFAHFYATEYAHNIAQIFQSGLEEALARAEVLAGEDGLIHISSRISYPKVLFYTGFPAPEYRESVRYTNYPAAFLDVSSFGPYRFDSLPPEAGQVSLMTTGEAGPYREAGFYVEEYDAVSVVSFPTP